MKKTINQKIIEDIHNQKIIPRSKGYFIFKEIVFWFGTILALLLGALSVGSFIFQSLNMTLLPTRLVFIFSVLRILVIILSLSFAVYQILNTEKGYKRQKRVYLFLGLFLAVVLGSVLFFTTIAGSVEKNIGTFGFIGQSKKYWSEPEKGLLAGELDFINGDGYLLINALDGKSYVVDAQNISEKNQDIFIDFLRVRMVGYEQGNIFYPCAVTPWEVRGAPKQRREEYQKYLNNDNLQFSQGKRNTINFKKIFERKNEIIRSNSC